MAILMMHNSDFRQTGLKQTTLPFKPVKKESKKRDKDSDDSDDEIDFSSISPPPQRSSRRAGGIDHFYIVQKNITDVSFTCRHFILTVESVFVVKKNYTMSSEDSDDSLEMFSPSDSEQT